MKKWTWKTWVMFGVVAAIFVAATVFLIIGITTHTEPGFTSPENRWIVRPLLVSCEVYAVEDPREADEVCNTVWDVVGVVNHRLGFQMLSENGDVGGHIHVRMRAPVEVGEAERDAPGGHFELTGTGTTYEHCDIWTMNVSGGASDLEWLTVYHEIGHCLGLAHDDYELSIMRPTQSRTPDRTIPPWISDWDRELLRGKYRPE